MTITPFLTLRLRSKKDVLLARQKSRRVAHLLNFDAHEQACIAAGTFVVALQALTVIGKARLCFQLENQTLHIFSQVGTPPPETSPGVNRISELLAESDRKGLFRLVKPLPAGQQLAESDLGWMVNKVQEVAENAVFDEIVKQNQEILTLLSELRLFRENSAQKEDFSKNPHAA
jgi:hypothetical protein